MEENKKKKWIVIGISIFVIIAVILFVIYTNYRNVDMPKKVLTTYFSYVNNKQYEAMYEMLTNASKEKISKEDFITRNKNIYEGIEATNLKIDIQEIKKVNHQKEVTYSENFVTAAGEVSFSNTATLKKEKGTYKLEWKSNLIFPQLEDDYKVRISTIRSRRGSIFDRNRTLLAYDGEIYQVGIVPGKLGEDKETSIQKISELLEISVEKINNDLSASYVKDDTFVPLKKISKTSEIKDQLLAIPGIMLSNLDARVYDFGEEAAHLIGYVQNISAEELEKNEGKGYTSKSLIGKSGAEFAYEDTLRGIDGSEIYIENANGDRVADILRQDKQDGKDVYLTIDANLQREFYNQMKEDKGFFVIMHPETGEILALVSTPSYNSNDFILGMSTDKWNSLNNDENKPLYNRFRQSYCPGSTFKSITAAIGLSENVIDASTELNYTGTKWQPSESWGDYYITTLTAYNASKNVENALIYSDNIFFAQLALKIGKDTLSNRLDAIGFNETLDFPLGLKKSQYLSEGNEFSNSKIANTGYGQGDVLVNPIHMASIYSAFVNNGNMVKPYLEYQDGKVNIWKEQVFTQDAVDTVKTALLKVVESSGGTAHDAKIEGQAILGKTGTAELKKSKDDTESGTLGWFDCITLNRPEGNLLIIGMVENVQNNSSGGSHYIISKIKNVLQN